MGYKKENLILSVSSENEAKIVVNKSIFIGIIRKVENREEVVKFKHFFPIFYFSNYTYKY